MSCTFACTLWPTAQVHELSFLSGVRKFTRATADPATQDETLCQVQVETVGTPTLSRVAVDHIQVSSVQWFNSRAVGRLVTPSTLQGIAMNLVTPCQCCHRFCGNELLTHRFKSPWETITK